MAKEKFPGVELSDPWTVDSGRRQSDYMVTRRTTMGRPERPAIDARSSGSGAVLLPTVRDRVSRPKELGLLRVVTITEECEAEMWRKRAACDAYHALAESLRAKKRQNLSLIQISEPTRLTRSS